MNLSVRKGLESVRVAVTDGMGAVAEEIASLAAALTWGLDQVAWALMQQSGTLAAIEQTLYQPSQVQANEKRLMGEQLLARGVPQQAEAQFHVALGLSPLDFRTYIGLAQCCLAQDRFDEARGHLEASLPHAPRAVGVEQLPEPFRLICGIKRSASEEEAEFRNAFPTVSPATIEALTRISQACIERAIPVVVRQTLEVRRSTSPENNREELARRLPGLDECRISVLAAMDLNDVGGWIRFIDANPAIPIDYDLASVEVDEEAKGTGTLACEEPTDWGGYSLRAIGRIHACRGEFDTACSVLRQAVQLSPGYACAEYDLAVYEVQRTGSTVGLGYLDAAMAREPSYWYTAQAERALEPVREQVREITQRLLAQASERASAACTVADRLVDAHSDKAEKIRALAESHRMAGYFHSVAFYDDLRARVDRATVDSRSTDYHTVLTVRRAAHDVVDRTAGVGAAINKEFAYVEGVEASRKLRTRW